MMVKSVVYTGDVLQRPVWTRPVAPLRYRAAVASNPRRLLGALDTVANATSQRLRWRARRWRGVCQASDNTTGSSASGISDGDSSSGGEEAAADVGAGATFTEWDTSECLTPRALICGLAVGSVVAAMNVSLGLKTGWGQGGSVTAAISAFAVFQAIKPAVPFTAYECNIAQTCASACGTMVAAGGLTSAIPALSLLGISHSIPALVGFALSVAFVGCLVGVPLRKPMIVEADYPFPEGTTTANTIKALYGRSAEMATKAFVLAQWFLASAIFTVAKYFLQQNLPSGLALPVPEKLKPFGFELSLDPMLFAIGVLVGPYTACAMGLGTVAAWGVLAPHVQTAGLVAGPAMAMTGARGFILWPGITLLTVGALAQLVFALGELVAASVRPQPGKVAAEDHPEQVPPSLVMWGLLLAGAGAVLSMRFAFGFPIWQTCISLLLSTGLSYVAVRCVGEININPIGGVGKVAQLLFSFLAPGNTGANVMQATVAAAGASQAGDMSTDFKTGYLLKASPWKQFQAQLVGIPFGAVVGVLAYKLFEAAYGIGSEQCPAPAAFAWKGVAELLANGLGSLPEGVVGMCTAAAVVATVLSIAQRVGKNSHWNELIPSPLAIGIAFIIPPSASLTIVAGGLVSVLWMISNPTGHAESAQEVGSGLLAGSGVAAVVVAILTLAGVSPLQLNA